MTVDQRIARLFGGNPQRDYVADLQAALANARIIAGYAADQERERGNKKTARYCHSLASERGELADAISDLDDAILDDYPAPRADMDPAFDRLASHNDYNRKVA